MPAQKKRFDILKWDPDFIALVSRGATRLPTLYKSEAAEDRARMETLCKVDDEQGVVTAIAYPPNQRDAHGDAASGKVIREAAYGYAKRVAKGEGGLKFTHQGKELSPDDIFVAEQFLVQPEDRRFHGLKKSDGADAGDLAGAWAIVLKVEKQELRSLFRDDQWQVSVEGPATVMQAKEEGADGDAVDNFLELLSKRLGGASTQPDEDIDMKTEELAALLEKSNEALLAKVDEKLDDRLGKKEEEDVTEEKDDTEEKTLVKFEGDPTKREDVEAHQLKVKKAELAKEAEGLDWSDQKAVDSYLEKVAELEPEEDDEDDDQDDEEEVEVEKSERRRPVPSRQVRAKKSEPINEDEKLAQVGLQLAKHYNEDMRGLKAV